jgi:hypothetical protein
LQNLFNTKDEDFHAKLRRSVANAFAMSTLVQFEPLVDSTITAFTDQLDQRFVDKPGPEGVLDFGMWLQYYAFDVIGQLTFSKRLGFVDEGRDVDNIISSLERTLDYVAVVSPSCAAVFSCLISLHLGGTDTLAGSFVCEESGATHVQRPRPHQHHRTCGDICQISYEKSFG